MTAHSVAIIGAGLGGLAAGVKLKEAGFEDLVILEKDGAVGGTWRDNRYPGCCCDVPVAMYQFSFAPSLSWSHIFPRSAEIQRYAEDVTDMFGLRGALRLNDEATRAEWDDARAVWKLTTGSGKTYEAKAIVAGLGQLNRPMWPAIEGRDSFKGESFHSARWKDGYDLKGKRVAVIGSAASAVQLIPEVAKDAAHLVVFQRTPNWVAPRMDRAITEEEKRLMITAPHVAALGRQLQPADQERGGGSLADNAEPQRDPDRVRALLEHGRRNEQAAVGEKGDVEEGRGLPGVRQVSEHDVVPEDDLQQQRHVADELDVDGRQFGDEPARR